MRKLVGAKGSRLGATLIVVWCAAGTARAQDAPAADGNAEPAGAEAGEIELTAEADADGDEELAPWRGSEFSYRNFVTLNSLDPSQDLTWNPYYAMEFGFKFRWWFDEIFYAGFRLDVTRELTEADDTTFDGEALLQDMVLAAGASKFYTIPLLEIDISADLLLTLPTSKLAQARTLWLGIGPGLTVSRTFDAIGPLTVAYHARFTPFFYEFSTAGRETPLIPSCAQGENGCDAFLNTGERNVQYRVQHGGSISWQPLEWLGASIGMEHIVDYLHEIVAEDPRISYQAQEGTDQRQASAFDVELTFIPIPALEIGLGYSTVSPQLSPDSTYYNPFYNRYSALYLDLRLEFEGLVSQILDDAEGGV